MSALEQFNEQFGFNFREPLPERHLVIKAKP